MDGAAGSTLLQFSFFIIFALLGTVLSIKLRQPYVVGLLIFGMLVGPHALSIVSDQNLIGTFSELGAILLLFAVGIEFSISHILKSGFRAVLITIFKMAVLFFLGYELALYFGLDLTSSLFIGAMLSITSTAILYKIVSEKGLLRNPTMPLLFSMLIVEDIVAVAALTFFSTLGPTSGTYEDKFYSVLVSLGLLGGFYLLVRKPAAAAILRLTESFSQEVMIFVSFSLCLVMSMVATLFGLSAAIGAFLAGSIVASLPNSKKIESTITPLLLMFASLFFLSLGMEIDPAAVLSNMGLSVSLFLVFSLAGFASVFVLLYLTGAKSQHALFGASAMVVMGEFSLLIASLASGPNASIILAVGSFGVVSTAILSSYLLGHQERLLEVGRKLMPLKAAASATPIAAYFTGLVRDFSPLGSFWRVSTAAWKAVSRELAALAIIAITIASLRYVVLMVGLGSGQASELRAAILLVGLLPVGYLAYRILREVKPVLDALTSSIARHEHHSKPSKLLTREHAIAVILRDAAISLFLVIAAAVLPEATVFLQLPSFFSFGDEILFLLALVFAWDIVRHAGDLRKSGK
jgi:CPA2 family monovalent cation:H+ antiporter-2